MLKNIENIIISKTRDSEKIRGFEAIYKIKYIKGVIV